MAEALEEEENGSDGDEDPEGDPESALHPIVPPLSIVGDAVDGDRTQLRPQHNQKRGHHRFRSIWHCCRFHEEHGSTDGESHAEDAIADASEPAELRMMLTVVGIEAHQLGPHHDQEEPTRLAEYGDHDGDEAHPAELGEVVLHGHSEVKDVRKAASERGHDASRRMTVREKHLGVKHLSWQLEAFCY